MSILEKLDRALARVEAALVVAIMAVMLGLSLVQLLLHALPTLATRLGASPDTVAALPAGFEWADIVVRQMVLWLGFVGGALATHEGRHIAIDAAAKFLGPRRSAGLLVVSSLAALVVVVVLTRASVDFVLDERAKGVTLFGDTPSWPWKAVMPVAFAAIAFHFVVAALKQLQVALGRRAPEPQEAA